MPHCPNACRTNRYSCPVLEALQGFQHRLAVDAIYRVCEKCVDLAVEIHSQTVRHCTGSVSAKDGSVLEPRLGQPAGALHVAAP